MVAEPSGPESPPAPRIRKRLVVCLDGTWNNLDDCTNVLHHFEFVHEGLVTTGKEPFLQLRFYHKGVGTGPLDRISGGAFGFGLEQNVRDAYDWLVQNYDLGDTYSEADEIYIFGFSRGAYTARSLVGFISRCGLLRRGSPLSVDELWAEYCELGRQREGRHSIWDSILGEEKLPIRQLTDLVADPWEIAAFERNRRPLPAGEALDPDRVLGQRVNNLTYAEKLLVRWSRRVEITYLGVYDTVGAMGIDALAIPGLKSKLAMHNNMRPTTLIWRCRHALAIDENRSSFNHTPFMEYIGLGLNEGGLGSAGSVLESANYWENQDEMWDKKIQQHWFVGSHSNVGGGYPDNELSQLPLGWLYDGAKELGLVCEPRPPISIVSLSPPRDSFAEFARPFWIGIFRGKRNYRKIAPETELRASRRAASADKEGTPPAGYSLGQIHELVDPSALAYALSHVDYAPPNLIRYAQGKRLAAGAGRTLTLLADRPLQHPWLGDKASAYAMLAVWATLAAIGIRSVQVIACAHQESPFPLWLACAVAFVFVLVDWKESRVNYLSASHPPLPYARAFLDSIYWTRALGVVLFAFGAAAALSRIWVDGWAAGSISAGWTMARDLLRSWWPVPVCAGAGVLVATLLDRAPKRLAPAAIGSLAGLLIWVGLVPVLMLVARLSAIVYSPLAGAGALAPLASDAYASLAGQQLVLILALVYFLVAFDWVGSPMATANLGRITSLQLCATPAAVVKCLERWRKMLECRWKAENAANGPAARGMRDIVGEVLWRDMVGFIPVYFAVFAFGLWFAAVRLEWGWLASSAALPVWLLIPLGGAVANEIEDVCHLRCLALQGSERQPNAALTMASFVLALLRMAAFVVSALVTIAATACGSWTVAIHAGETGWRGSLVLLISVLAALAAVAVCAMAAYYRGFKGYGSQKRSAFAAPETK